MAKEYQLPFDVPEFNPKDHEAGWGAYRQWYADTTKAVKARVRDLAHADPGSLTGSLLRWPRADGQAVYVVLEEKPLAVAHVPIGDAWSVEPALIRGLRIAEVRDMVRRDAAMSRLFGGPRSD